MFGHFVGCHKIRLEICLWWVFSYIKALFICDFIAMLSWGASCDFFSGSAGQYVCDVRHLPRASWVEGNRHSRAQWCSYFSRRSVIGWIFKFWSFWHCLVDSHKNHVSMLLWLNGQLAFAKTVTLAFLTREARSFKLCLMLTPFKFYNFIQVY